jgi:soluble P-type ATPase
MFEIDIPGFGLIRLNHLVSDFTGALSVDGFVLDGIKEKLNKIAGFLNIHIVTADTFGRARAELNGINCAVHILNGSSIDKQKEEYVMNLDADKVIAFGNGNNDRGMLNTARIGVAVCLKEGCAIDAIMSANIFTTTITDALDLLIYPDRLKATLRY